MKRTYWPPVLTSPPLPETGEGGEGLGLGEGAGAGVDEDELEDGCVGSGSATLAGGAVGLGVSLAALEEVVGLGVLSSSSSHSGIH